MFTRAEFKYLLTIILIFTTACIETDIYLPAFPDMMIYFGATEGSIQSLLTWNFVGICISSPFYGPISDALGRKKPLMVALGIFMIGSLITLFSQNFEYMLFGRILQGIGSGGCFTLGTAVIFDFFQKEKAVSALAVINTITPFIMASAPLFGGYLNYAFGFRSNFIAIAIFVFLSFFICSFFYQESHSAEKRVPLQMKKIMQDFKRAFTCIPFWQLIIVVSLPFAGYLTFLSGTAILFVVEFGIGKEWIPLYQIALLGSWLVASVTCKKALEKWGLFKIKMIGTAAITVSAVGIIVSTLLDPQNTVLPTAVMMLFAFGANWTQGIYFPESMELLPEIKGTTASLLTCARLLIAACVVGLAAKYYNGTIYPVIIANIAVIITTLVVIFFYERKAKELVSEKIY